MTLHFWLYFKIVGSTFHRLLKSQATILSVPRSNFNDKAISIVSTKRLAIALDLFNHCCKLIKLTLKNSDTSFSSQKNVKFWKLLEEVHKRSKIFDDFKVKWIQLFILWFNCPFFVALISSFRHHHSSLQGELFSSSWVAIWTFENECRINWFSAI